MEGRATIRGRLVTLRPREEADMKFRRNWDDDREEEFRARFDYEERSPGEYHLTLLDKDGGYIGEIRAKRTAVTWVAAEVWIALIGDEHWEDGSAEEGLGLFLVHVRDEFGVAAVRAEVVRENRTIAECYRRMGFELEAVEPDRLRLELDLDELRVAGNA